MSKLPPKPKGPLLLKRVLFTSVLGASCGGTSGHPQPPQVAPPPQPPQPYYDEERDIEATPMADAGPGEVVPLEEETAPQVEYAEPPPQVAPPPDDGTVKKGVPIQKKSYPPQVAPRPTDDNPYGPRKP